MHLILERNMLDDLPLRMFDSLPMARGYCSTYEPTIDGEAHPDRERTCELMGLDSSTPQNLTIISFNSDGEPVSFEIAKQFEESPA